MDQLPSPFTPVETALPPSEKPVLVIRRSGYVSAEYEVLTARYQPAYRPRAPWRDLSGDDVNDSGTDVLGWAPMDAWLHG